MLSPEAVRLRIALALVLLEHQPAGLSLHDYLKALRNEVKKRKCGGRPEEESVTSDNAEGSAEGEEEQPDEPEDGGPVAEAPVVEEKEQVEQVEPEPEPELSPEERLRLAASSLGPAVAQAVERLLQRQTAADPFLPSQFSAHAASALPRILGGSLGAVLDALEASLQESENRSSGERAGLRWEELGTVLEWLLPQVAGLPDETRHSEEPEAAKESGMKTRGKKRKGGKGATASEVEERTRAELVEQLTQLLLRMATSAFDAPLSLSVFASLLIHHTSFFPVVTLSRFFPFFLDQLASLLPPFMQTCEIEDSQLERLAALVSLLHLAFDALPPPDALQFFLVNDATDTLRPLRLSLERLTHLLTSTSPTLDPDTLSLRILPTSGGDEAVTVEEAVLGALERCWEVSELDEREGRGQVEAAVEAGD